MHSKLSIAYPPIKVVFKCIYAMPLYVHQKRCAIAILFVCTMLLKSNVILSRILPKFLISPIDRSNKRLHVGEKCCFISLHAGILLQHMVLAFNDV